MYADNLWQSGRAVHTRGGVPEARLAGGVEWAGVFSGAIVIPAFHHDITGPRSTKLWVYALHVTQACIYHITSSSPFDLSTKFFHCETPSGRISACRKRTWIIFDALIICTSIPSAIECNTTHLRPPRPPSRVSRIRAYANSHPLGIAWRLVRAFGRAGLVLCTCAHGNFLTCAWISRQI